MVVVVIVIVVVVVVVVVFAVVVVAAAVAAVAVVVVGGVRAMEDKSVDIMNFVNLFYTHFLLFYVRPSDFLLSILRSDMSWVH